MLVIGAISRRRHCRDRGFTLIELLVVVIILGIISGVVVFAVRGSGDKGAAAAKETDLRTLRTAQEAFCARYGRYAENEAQLVNPKLADPSFDSKGFLSEESEMHDISGTNDGSGPCNGWRYSLGPGGPGGPSGPGAGNPSAICGAPEGWCEVAGEAVKVSYASNVRSTVVQLQSGKVLTVVTVGLSPVPFLYDPALGSNGTWIPGPPITPEVRYAGGGSTLVLLTDNPATPENECGSAAVDNCGKVLALIGGSTPQDGEWRLYDPDTGPLGAWSAVPSPPGYEPQRQTGNWSVRAGNFTDVLQLTGTAEQCGENCGKVIIVGQHNVLNGAVINPNSFLTPAVAELYDPATNKFTVAEQAYAPAGEYISGVTLAQLHDGRVLMVGFRYETADSKVGSPWAKLFNPRTSTFADATAPSFRHSLGYNPLSVLPNGAVLGVGKGATSTDVGAEIYTPNATTGSWTGPQAVATCGSEAKPYCWVLGSLANGTVIANRSGGTRVSGGSTDIFFFDPTETDKDKMWRQTGSLNSGDTPGVAVLLARGACPGPQCNKLLAAGKESSEVYAPQ